MGKLVVLVLMGHKVIGVLMAEEVQMVQMVMMEILVLMVSIVTNLVKPENKDLRDLVVVMAPPDVTVRQALQAFQVHQVVLEMMVILVARVHQV